MKIFSLVSVLAFAALAACGDDGASGGGGAGATGGGGEGGGGAGAGGGEPTLCGDILICDPGVACVEQQFPPACTDKANKADPCPEGQTDTFCGGAGMPCCCEPPPAPDYSCAAADNCGGTVSCECLGDVCTGGLECVNTATPNIVACIEPAMP
jgi:hypothetical protein